MVYGGLLSDFWEILGLGLYGTLCSGNRLNIFGPLSQILKVISAQFATFFMCSVWRKESVADCEFSNHGSTFFGAGVRRNGQ